MGGKKTKKGTGAFSCSSMLAGGRGLGILTSTVFEESSGGIGEGLNTPLMGFALGRS